MIIILARHGNTFNPGDRIYRVGKRNNLPLTEQGIAQAENFASALIDKKITPCTIYCSPLRRTQEFAQTILRKINLNIQPQIDERLNEIDYGSWSGLTDEEINVKYPRDLKRWKEFSQWPQNSNWPETECAAIEAATDFAHELVSKHKTDDTVLVISSCGKLRYFLKLVDNAFQDRLKNNGVTVKTGNACEITHQNDKFTIEAWNINPAELHKNE